MKVKELIELLKQTDQDLDVYVSKYSEGSLCSKLDYVTPEITLIQEDNEFNQHEIFYDDDLEGYSDEDVIEMKATMQKGLILFPT